MARLLADLTPLKVSPAYRRLWIGNSLSAVGMQVTMIAVSLEIYELTKSSFYVGLVGLFGLVPLVITGLYGGSIADAYDRRKVALFSSLALWIVTCGIALQAWLGLRNVWIILILIALHSAASGINQPTRGAIIPALVGHKLLPAANSLNMVTFGVAMMVGPLVGGLLVAGVGYAWTYTLDVVTFLAALYSVYRLPSLPPERNEDGTARQAGLSSVIDGFKFLGTHPNVRMTFLIDLASMVLASPRALLPAIGAVLLGGGGTTVGILLGAVALGTLLTGLFSGPLSIIHHQGKAVYFSVSGWAVSMVGLGVVVLWAMREHGGPLPLNAPMTGFVWVAAFFMLTAGIADSISAVFRNTILQSAAPDHLRGRLQGVFVVVVAGGPRLGDMLAGGVASVAGEGWTLVIGGIVSATAAAALMLWQPGFMRYDSRNPKP
ncbi:MFS transporter [Neomicrococcus lactis]|uniref:MFS transporter n=1 Tax=Neomicrococcus lactis TaxID=732241 RepID=UPI0023016F7D|nr:MFS transporter [Neomicrococcus lactis]